MEIRVGCAGWTIPKSYADRFPSAGSHLERYAARFSAVEVNSSFYALHRPETYVRWATQVPESFRFSVKISRRITHGTRLADPSLLDDFLPAVLALGARLGPLLVQLPPSLAYDADRVSGFLAALRTRFSGGVVCEPRHASWFSVQADSLLAQFEVARVAADPPPVPGAARLRGWTGLHYYRLHGSPRTYYSAYPPEFIDGLAATLRAAAGSAPVWCIFDNTAVGAAAENALALLGRL